MRYRCDNCGEWIQRGELQWHHPIPRSEGGTDTVPYCRGCHVRHHSKRGDFARWGRLGGQASAALGHWAHHLRRVRDHANYAPLRASVPPRGRSRGGRA